MENPIEPHALLSIAGDFMRACAISLSPKRHQSIPCCPALNGRDVGFAIGRATTALAVCQHLAQALHGFMMRVMQ